MEGAQSIDHGEESNDGEYCRRDASDTVTEIEKADSEAAEDDGEVEPGEKSALIGEEDFGLHSGGEGDALACGLEFSRTERRR